MKFRQLEAFQAVMTTGSMKAAADLLHVTQPAISRLISDLESSLCFRLFDRRKGTLSPTREGLEFYCSVEENFLGLERLRNAADQIRSEGHSLKIAVTHMLSATLMPRVIKRFRRKFPDCRLQIYSHRLAQVMQRMQNMSVDMAIASQLPDMNSNRRVCLGSCAQACVLPSGHPLSRLPEIRAEDLEGESILTIVADGPAYWGQPADLLREAKIPFQAHFEVDTSLAAYGLIAEGLAIGIIEPFGAQLWEGRGAVLRPFMPEVRTSYYYTTASHSGVRSDLEWFEKCLIEEASAFLQRPAEGEPS